MRRQSGETEVLKKVVNDAMGAKFNPKEIAGYFGRERSFVYRLMSIRGFKAKQRK